MTRLSDVRIAAAAALVGVLLGGVASPAAATVYNSSVGNIGSAAGYSYTNQATIDNAIRWASTKTNANAVAPPGYIGSNGRLFRSSGSLCAESGFAYTSTSASGYQVFSPSGGCGSGYYYGYGVSRFWNGNGYNSAYTFKTPNLNF